MPCLPTYYHIRLLIPAGLSLPLGPPYRLGRTARDRGVPCTQGLACLGRLTVLKPAVPHGERPSVPAARTMPSPCVCKTDDHVALSVAVIHADAAAAAQHILLIFSLAPRPGGAALGLRVAHSIQQ